MNAPVRMVHSEGAIKLATKTTYVAEPATRLYLMPRVLMMGPATKLLKPNVK